MSENDKLRDFLKAASLRFKTHKSDIANQISRALASEHIERLGSPPEAAPATLELLNFLPKRQTALIACLAKCRENLSWREAGFGKLPKEFSKRIFASELIGPNGLFESSNVRIGLLIQREHLSYPKHWHAAEELYLVLNGTAYWSTDDDPEILCPPESFVHHKSRQPHSMTTNAEPILALWGWTGDVDGKSYSI